MTISGLKILNGSAVSTDGLSGGGIRNLGNVTVMNCTLANGDGSSLGGGILNGSGGTLVVKNCALSGNQAINGGGIYNSGSLTISNSTLYGNSASNGSGGGIENPGSLSVFNCTITNNTATASGGAGGGIFGGASHVRSTVIAGNTANSSAADVGGNFVSDGYNFIGIFYNQATGFGTSGSHDQTGTTASPANPSLAPFQDNGGLTMTREPIVGSPLIDQGNGGGLTSDQRGQPRPIDQPGVPNAAGGDASDIGAVEMGLVQSGPTFTVTTTGEHTDGTCSADDCTLLEALNATNANADANTIVFAPNLYGLITTFLTPSGLGIINPVTIRGPGARQLGVTGSGSGRAFNISAQNVAIYGLTITEGSTSGDGAGVYNTGGLTLSDCEFTDNVAFGTTSNGAAVNNVSGATLTLVRCTFFQNIANQFGGGLFSDGTYTATNCTFVGNTAFRGGAIISRFNGGLSSSTLRNCTITGNTATSTAGGVSDGGGGYYAEGGAQQVHVSNTIIALNTNSVNPDVRGNYTSDGHNLIGKPGSSSAGFTNGVNGDLVGTNASGLNPQFAGLANNGGDTYTDAILAGSLAINAGNDALAPITDQRGYLRSGTSDMGAFEFGGSIPVLKITSITRLASGHISLQGLGIASSAHTIEAAFDPNASSFNYLGTTTSNGSGILSYDDAGAVSLTRRFYRLAFP